MKKLLSVLARAAAFFLGFCLLAGLLPVPFDEHNAALWRFGAELVPLLAAAVLTAAFCARERGRVRVPLLGQPMRGLRVGLVTGVVWIVICAGVLTIAGAISFTYSGGVSLLWLWVLSAALNTVMQELLIRGYLYQLVKTSYGIGSAVASTTLLFTLLHGGAVEAGVVPTLNALTASLLLTALLEAADGLLAPILAHAVWNIVGGLFLGGVNLADDYPHLMTASGSGPLSGGDCLIEGSVVVLAVNVLAAGGLACLLLRRRTEAKKEPLSTDSSPV